MRRIFCAEIAKKVRAILPMDMFLIYEANVSFINQGRGLKRVPLSLPVHISPRHSVQFVVDKRVQFVEGSLISVAPFSKQLRNLVRWRGRFFHPGAAHGLSESGAGPRREGKKASARLNTSSG
jgi:hypothetical protein